MARDEKVGRPTGQRTTLAITRMPTTIDRLLDGAVSIEQPAPGHGYRVNADAVLLARFAAESAESHADVIDLGAGVGAVALTLHALVPVGSVIFVERNPVPAELARRNAQRSGIADRATIAVAEVDAWAQTHAASSTTVIVANPPYTQPGAGRRGGNPSRDDARHGDLAPFIEAMRHLLRGNLGRACMCYPAANIIDVLELAQRAELHVKRLRFVHPSPERPARIVLLELSSIPSDPTVLDPWFDAAANSP